MNIAARMLVRPSSVMISRISRPSFRRPPLLRFSRPRTTVTPDSAIRSSKICRVTFGSKVNIIRRVVSGSMLERET